MITPPGCKSHQQLESFKGLTLDGSPEAENLHALQRRRKSTKRKAHRPDFRAPISVLPRELLQEIFEWGWGFAPEISTPPFEVTVSHVSSSWRAAALSTPLLWSTLDISLRSKLDFIEAYLQRSKKYPLELRFDFFWRSERSGSFTSVENIFDLVIAQSGRWNRFFAEGDIDSPIVTLVKRCRDVAAPQLSHFSIFIESDFPEPDTPEIDFRPQIFTGAAPLLDTVRLGGIALRECRPPLDSVTILDLKEISRWTRITYNRFRDMVTSCPALTKLIIKQQVIQQESWPDLIINSIPLPSLRFLRFQGYPDSVSKVLLAISAIHLESLSFNDIHHNALYDFFKSCQARPTSLPFPCLTTLSLESLNWGKSQWQSLFQAFPTIMHVEFTCRFTGFTRCLGQTVGSTVPLPDLHSVTIRHVYYNDDQESHDYIYDFISDRISTGRPIQRLFLDNAEEAATDRMDWLREQVQIEILDEEAG
jgi:hypothetical protein